MKNNDELFIKRCLDLARLGKGHTSPNPNVGAVIVYKNRIIGEGYHQYYGEAHAEVNAVGSVSASDRALLPYSTLYVSLEPCSIFGHTPPCTNLILAEKIPRVVIAGLDRTPGVNGQGIKTLKDAGVEVVLGVLAEAGMRLNNIRNTFVTLGRPYIILKFAQSRDHKIARIDRSQIWLTNGISKRLVHKWRAESDAILVGTNTAQFDNPQLNNRLHFGPSPIRLVLDQHLRLSSKIHFFDQSHPTIVFTDINNTFPASKPNLEYVGIPFGTESLSACLNHLHSKNIATLLVEGGAQLLNSFISANLWDEARVFTGNKWLIEGIEAPTLPIAPIHEKQVYDDKLQVFYNKQPF